jgi:hypothetical protein
VERQEPVATVPAALPARAAVLAVPLAQAARMSPKYGAPGAARGPLKVDPAQPVSRIAKGRRGALAFCSIRDTQLRVSVLSSLHLPSTAASARALGFSVTGGTCARITATCPAARRPATGSAARAAAAGRTAARRAGCTAIVPPRCAAAALRRRSAACARRASGAACASGSARRAACCASARTSRAARRRAGRGSRSRSPTSARTRAGRLRVNARNCERHAHC